MTAREKLVALMRAGRHLTANEIEDELQVSRNRVRQLIDEMIDAGEISVVGSRRGRPRPGNIARVYGAT